MLLDFGSNSFMAFCKAANLEGLDFNKCSFPAQLLARSHRLLFNVPYRILTIKLDIAIDNVTVQKFYNESTVIFAKTSLAIKHSFNPLCSLEVNNLNVGDFLNLIFSDNPSCRLTFGKQFK